MLTQGGKLRDGGGGGGNNNCAQEETDLGIRGLACPLLNGDY